MSDMSWREAIESMTGIIEPGDTMFVILHTGKDGIAPPPDGERIEADGHAFGPFVSEDEARDWQETADTVTDCSCHRFIVPVIVPRILAVVGPAGIPVEQPGARDGLN
jgi:hypothetical protein